MVLKLKQKLRLSAPPIQKRLGHNISDSSSGDDDDDDEFDVADDSNEANTQQNNTTQSNDATAEASAVESTTSMSAPESVDIYDPHALTRHRLREHLQQVCAHLPDDLRHLLRVNNEQQREGGRRHQQESKQQPQQHIESKMKSLDV